MAFLSLLLLPWVYGNYQQLTLGMTVTGLSDQVSWGIYLANFVFLVGVAAAAVTIVFPAYVYHYEPLHKVVILGEMLAIAAVIMSLLFVLSHMGRPERAWHILPYIGIFNFPSAMLAWDVVVLNGYLLLNAITGFYCLYKIYVGEPVNRKFLLPVIYVSIVWALSIHTVTAFLINTMPSRPMWNHSMMPIRFITTAFAAGPSLIIVVFLTIRKHSRLWIEDEAINMLSTIVTFSLGIGVFLTLSEVVTELYASTEHADSLKYLMFGKNGLNNLVPWFWSSVTLMVGSFVLLLVPKIRKNLTILPWICVMVFAGIWIEKGMALIVPGSIPTPIGEYSQYQPSMIEVMNSIGNWALGLIIMSLLMKGAIGILLGDLTYKGTVNEAQNALTT